MLSGRVLSIRMFAKSSQIVAGYSFAVTVGLLLASVVGYATQNRFDTGS